MGWMASGVFCCVALLVLFFHVRISHDSFSKVMDFCGHWRRTPDRKDVRVEERLRKIQLKNYKLICKGMCHFILPSVLFALRDAVLTPGLSNFGTCCALFVAYFHNLFVGADMVTVTPRLMKVACYILHVFTLLLAVCTSLDSSDLMAFSYNKSYMATTRLILLGFVDKSVTIPFNVLHAFVDIGMYFLLFDDATVWTSLPSICISEMSFTLASISLSYALDIWVRSWIESLLETADAESLVSSFRRMLRGISDGEVLLDSDYKICGEGQCVQHLIITTMSLAGKPFDRFLIDDEERERFAGFLQSSTESCEAESSRRGSACPECLRVSLRCTAGNRVAVDMYHVPVPGLYGASKPFHLIAFKEDSESRMQPEAPEEVPQTRLESAGSGAARSSSTASRRTDGTVAEVQQLTLLLDVNTEHQDVLELRMTFQHEEAEPTATPSLQKMLMPMDWPILSAKVLKFADQAFWNPHIPPKRLRAVPVRLPNEDRYILARRASIQSVRGSESGSQVWLHLKDFIEYNGRRFQPLQRTLDNIQEGLRSRGPRPWP